MYRYIRPLEVKVKELKKTRDPGSKVQINRNKQYKKGREEKREREVNASREV